MVGKNILFAAQLGRNECKNLPFEVSKVLESQINYAVLVL